MKNSLLAAGFVLCGAMGAQAASLGLDTTDPVLTVDPANVTFSDLFGEGDLSMFDLVTDISGLTTNGDVTLGFGVGFDLIDPTMALSGGFDLSDDDGLLLSGNLTATGFGDDVIELQFDSLSGSATGAFSDMVLLEIVFDPADGLSDAPFGNLEDLTTYMATVTLSNVGDLAPIPLPAGLPLLVVALGGFGWLRARQRA